MTLLADIREMTAISERINSGNELAQQAVGIQTRAVELEGLAQRCGTAVARSLTLRAHGVPMAPPPKLAAIARAGRETLEVVDREPAAIINLPGDLRFRFIDEMGGLVRDLDVASLSAWREHVEAQMPRIDLPLFDALPTVTEQHRTELVKVLQRHQEIIQSAPADEAAYSRLAELVAAARRLVAAVDIDGLPADVRRFVQAVARQSATLDLVTPPVMDWLIARDLVTRVKVSFGGSR